MSGGTPFTLGTGRRSQAWSCAHSPSSSTETTPLPPGSSRAPWHLAACPCWQRVSKARTLSRMLAPDAEAPRALRVTEGLSHQESADKHACGPALAKACSGVLAPEHGSPLGISAPFPRFWGPEINDTGWPCSPGCPSKGLCWVRTRPYGQAACARVCVHSVCECLHACVCACAHVHVGLMPCACMCVSVNVSTCMSAHVCEHDSCAHVCMSMCASTCLHMCECDCVCPCV